MGKKVATKGDKLKYDLYQSKGSFLINKKRKLAKHMRLHPNDLQSKEAKLVFTRKAPNNKLGWLTESIKKDVMVTVPYLSSKGNPINLKFPEQLETLTRTFGQAIPITRSSAMGFAQVAKFLRKAPYRLTLVPVKTKDNVDFQWKHIAVPFTKV